MQEKLEMLEMLEMSMDFNGFSLDGQKSRKGWTDMRL